MYTSSASCGWQIVPSGGGTIRLSFMEFATEAGYDFLKVYDGLSPSGQLLNDGQTSGSAMPGPLLATSGAMYVSFVSDSSVEEQGFSATYFSLPEGLSS